MLLRPKSVRPALIASRIGESRQAWGFPALDLRLAGRADERVGGRKNFGIVLTISQHDDKVLTMSKIKATLVDQVRQAVRESGSTQIALADLADIDKTALSRFLSGERGLSMADLDSLADVLRLKVVATGKPPAIPRRKPGPKPKRKAV
jgi:hypothetical protein